MTVVIKHKYGAARDSDRGNVTGRASGRTPSHSLIRVTVTSRGPRAPPSGSFFQVFFDGGGPSRQAGRTNRLNRLESADSSRSQLERFIFSSESLRRAMTRTPNPSIRVTPQCRRPKSVTASLFAGPVRVIPKLDILKRRLLKAGPKTRSRPGRAPCSAGPESPRQGRVAGSESPR